MENVNIKRYASFLTNGSDKIMIEANRYNCFINPPAGVSVTFLNGDTYINGKLAWVEIMEDGGF